MSAVRVLLWLLLPVLLSAQVQVRNAKLTNVVIAPSNHLQIAPMPTIYSACGQRPAGVSLIVYDTSFTDPTCATRSYKVDGTSLKHTIVSITGPAQAGFAYPVAALQSGGQINSNASLGVAYIDPAGSHLLFEYQSAANAAINIDPGGGYSFYLAACNGVPCTSTNYNFIATASNWPTLTAGIASCNAKYGAGTGCPMGGVLDAIFVQNADGSTDINHIILTVLESGGLYWATYVANVNWPAANAPPSITAVNFRYTPADSLYTTQFAGISGCPHYIKADGATNLTFVSGVPTAGTIYYHADLNPYSSNLANCDTRGANISESVLYGYNIATATATLIGPLAQTGQAVLNSQTGFTCAAGGTCDGNRYAEFPMWIPNALPSPKLIFGGVYTSPTSGTSLLNGNNHMEFFTSALDGSNPEQLTTLNNFGTPEFKTFAKCGYAGVAKPYYDPIGETLLAAIATCQSGPNGYNQSTNWIVRWPLNYTGSPVYNVTAAAPALVAAASTILGPYLTNASNPWPYADQLEIQGANYFASQQTSTCQQVPYGGSPTTDCYVDYWNTPHAGTVSVVNSSQTATFSGGTAPDVLFCGGSGGTTPTGSGANTIPIGLDIWYTAGAHRLPAGVTACTPTTVTMYAAWPEATESGLTFSTYDNYQDGGVEGASSNWNYYDNVEAFYLTYFHTGNSAYLTAARTLADRWYTQPFIDKGQRAIEGIGTYLLHPRQLALTGLVLRALDGKASYWTGIEAINQAYATYNMTGGAIQDVREAGYMQYFLMLQSMYDPNPSGASCGATTCALYARGLFDTNVTAAWTPSRVTTGVNAGAWQSITYGNATWNGQTGTMSFTSGSNTVTSSVALVSSDFSAGNSFYFLACPGAAGSGAPTANSQCDAQAYIPTQIDATHFSISPTYGGTTRTVSSWQFGLEVGIGTLPYQLNMPYRAWDLARIAGDVTAPFSTWEDGIVSYWQGTAYRSATRGLWYASGFPNCGALGNGPIDCDESAIGVGISTQGSRDLTPEIMGSLALAYQRTGNSTLHTFNENVYSAQWAGPSSGCAGGTDTGPTTGGALVDHTFVVDLEQTNYGTGCTYNFAVNPKYFGFQFGFGGGQIWPAVR